MERLSAARNIMLIKRAYRNKVSTYKTKNWKFRQNTIMHQCERDATATFLMMTAVLMGTTAASSWSLKLWSRCRRRNWLLLRLSRCYSNSSGRYINCTRYCSLHNFNLSPILVSLSNMQEENSEGSYSIDDLRQDLNDHVETEMTKFIIENFH